MATTYEPLTGRIPIRQLRPQTPDDLFPSKSHEGDIIPFSCVAFREGHDRIGVELVITSPSGATRRIRMREEEPGTDTWRARAQLDGTGLHEWHVEAWADEIATWRHAAVIKIPAGIDVELMLEEGARLMERAAQEPQLRATQRDALLNAAVAARTRGASASNRLGALISQEVECILAEHPLRSLVTRSQARRIRCERQRAGYGAWYELFPRSEGAIRHEDGSWTSGTFRTAARRLPAVARMGFDVLYLPPIHPIGVTNRKGPNNTLIAAPGDPGSPWAIGSAEGGHTEIHPDLGTLDDFRFFLAEAERNGLEVALDIALQATPDHPWVREHPEWFTILADGSIAYAENPPKKYQDIYPLNFDRDPEGLYQEILRVFRHWISLGVRIFRIDNPHTKPLHMWERLLHEIGAEHPDVIFLAEAFTRPAMMQALGQAGFQQSYTYFTWRNEKRELEEYLSEVSRETSDWMRPNFFVNTPDILSQYLQLGGRPAYRARAVIAAMSSPLWGMYAGYELVENVARPGSEENIDNEKYEYKQRDWAAEEARGTSLAPFITQLNEIRRAHPALQQLRNFTVQRSDSDQILAFSKYLPAEFSPDGRADAIIVVVNLDPYAAREATVRLDLPQIGQRPGARFQVDDLLSGQSWQWGEENYVRLDPHDIGAHILHVREDAHAEEEGNRS